MKRYAVADEVPEDCDYLTAGKEYECLEFDDLGWLEFLDDNGAQRAAFSGFSFHLNGKSWRIVEREE